MSVEIAISGGFVAKVDADFVGVVSGFRWYAHKREHTTYARSKVFGRSGPWVFMHRLIAFDIQEGMVVDHADGDGLNNVLTNLRVCTHAQNCRNAEKPRRVMSYRGVESFGDGRFFARIMVGGKRHTSGPFASQELAALEYNRIAQIHHGEFATLNDEELIASRMAQLGIGKK